MMPKTSPPPIEVFDSIYGENYEIVFLLKICFDWKIKVVSTRSGFIAPRTEKKKVAFIWNGFVLIRL